MLHGIGLEAFDFNIRAISAKKYWVASGMGETTTPTRASAAFQIGAAAPCHDPNSAMRESPASARPN